MSNIVSWLFKNDSEDEIRLPITDLEHIMGSISSESDVSSNNQIAQGGVIKREYLTHDIVAIIGVFDNNHIPVYTNYEKGARYFNSTTNKLYLRWTNGWVQPTTPDVDRMFINLATGKLCHYFNGAMVDAGESDLNRITATTSGNTVDRIAQGGVIKREYLTHDIMTIVGIYDNSNIPAYTNYEKGARYFNSTTNKLYLRWTDGWIQPVEPDIERMFVNLSNGKLYRYYNNAMIEVGGENNGGGNGGGGSYDFSNEFTVLGSSVSFNSIAISKVSGLNTALTGKQDVLTSSNAGEGVFIQNEVINTYYTGPFRVYSSTETVNDYGNYTSVFVSGGNVVIGSRHYEYAGGSINSVGSGDTVMLECSSNTANNSIYFSAFATSQIYTGSLPSNVILTRLAKNEGGIMKQLQFGDIVTVPFSIVTGGTGAGGVTTEQVDAAISDALSNFVIRYGLTAIPIVKYSAPTIQASRQNSVVSNTDVVLTAVGWDTAIITKQYSTDNSTWQTYPVGGVTVTTNNQTRYFRGLDSSGDMTEVASYTVTNIDKTGPTINLTGYDSRAYVAQTVTATTPETNALLYWNINNGAVSSSTSPATINVTTSGSLVVSASDAYGNKTTKTVTFNNVGKTPALNLTGYNSSTATNSTLITASLANNASDLSISWRKGNTGSWSAYSSPVNATSNTTYNFRALDVTNATISTASVTFTNIDTAAPVITLNVSGSTITASVNDSVDIYWRFGSTGNWTKYTVPVVATEYGTYNFKATDAAGNTGTASQTFEPQSEI